ncbi:retron St85 family effector protein [Burkholderia gladioli]|uniref:retron St85 family effector protein n=1 Tax=Burkholderia gladioli TaxID=28095 RepID=UPI001ABB00F7|nr:retron St85 family effector protein [Burkholderia gladioli]
MLEKYLDLPRFKLGGVLNSFSAALDKGRFSIRRDLSLIFLCGANKSGLTPSERRFFLKKSIEKELPHARIVYAEAVMEELAKHGKTKNLLDIEFQISKIADWILIVLESYSSFCELGAFSHKSSRDKLIVVNDNRYQSQPSFINHGPIQAITEDCSLDRVVWYPMSDDGVYVRDAIGMALPGVLKTLRHVKARGKIDKESCLPSSTSQTALFFLHDIIYLCGPITHSETILIYSKIFGDQSFDEVKALRGILHASNLIESIMVGAEHSYISRTTETFINFESGASNILSAFRRYHLKHNPQRLINA